MPAPLLECVPNISDGRDPAVVAAVAQAFASAGAVLLDVESDRDHHRSVITIAGLGRAALYAGSWSEWCNTPGLPCAQG